MGRPDYSKVDVSRLPEEEKETNPEVRAQLAMRGVYNTPEEVIEDVTEIQETLPETTEEPAVEVKKKGRPKKIITDDVIV